MTRVRRAAPVVLGAIALALLGACGEDEPATGPGPASTERAAGAGDDGDDGGGRAAGADPEVCSIVPAPAVERVIGASSTEPRDASVGGEKRCQYQGEEGAQMLVATGPSSGYDRFVSTFEAKPVDGIGDRAAERGSELYVLIAVKGERYVSFSVGGAIGDSGIAPVDKDAARQAMTESLESL